MSSFLTTKERVFILLQEYNIPEKIYDQIQKFNEKNFFVRTQRLIKNYSKLLRRKSINVEGLLYRIEDIQTEWELDSHKKSILTALKGKIPDEEATVKTILDAKSKQGLVNFLIGQPSLVTIVLKRNKIYPFNIKKKSKKQHRKSNYKTEKFNRRSQDNQHKFSLCKSRILQCLKRRNVPESHLEFLLKLDSMDKMIVFLYDVLPNELQYLKSKGMLPLAKRKQKKQVKKKGPFVKIIYTPMGNKR